MLFKELARLGAEQLAKQKPVTLEKAREQARRVEARISSRKAVLANKTNNDNSISSS